MKSFTIPLRVVFYYEQDRWIAHCLEFDLIGDGVSREEALDCLKEAISIQIATAIEQNNPLNLFTPAAGRYFQMFAQGKNIGVNELEFHMEGYDFDQVEAREYAGSVE